MRLTPVFTLAIAGLAAAPVLAQTLLDVGSLRELNDAEIIGANGDEIGEIEDVLVDATGRPVAVTVEMDEGFLGQGEEEIVFSFDQLTWEDGNYSTALTEAEIEALPRYDD